MEIWKYSLAVIAAIVTALIAGTAYIKLPEHALEQAKELGVIQANLDTLQKASESQSVQLEQQHNELLLALDRAKQAEDSLKELESTLIKQKKKANSLNEDLEKLIEEVTGSEGINNEEKLKTLREFVNAIQDNEAGATLLALQNDVAEVRNRKPPGSSDTCEWISISNPTGGHAGALKGKAWTASCPNGSYVKSYGLNTWNQDATYHHKM